MHFRRLRVASLSVAVGCCLGAGCAGLCSPSSAAPGESAALRPDAPRAPLRILTINAWSGLTYDGVLSIGRCADDDPDARFRLLVERIRELAPDVVAVQEANPLPSFAERLAEETGYSEMHRVCLGGIRIGPVGVPVNLREGQVVLVRPPATLEDLGSCKLEGCGLATDLVCFHLGEITRVLGARTVVNGKPLLVFAVHLHSGPFGGAALDDARRAVEGAFPAAEVDDALASVREDAARRSREVVSLLDFIGESAPAEAQAILLGDFNTAAGSGELEPLLGNGAWLDSFRSAHGDDEGTTWDPAGNPNFRASAGGETAESRLRALHERSPARIDFILLRGIEAARIVESRVVLGPRDGACPSDHYGVLTTIEW